MATKPSSSVLHALFLIPLLNVPGGNALVLVTEADGHHQPCHRARRWNCLYDSCGRAKSCQWLQSKPGARSILIGSSSPS